MKEFLIIASNLANISSADSMTSIWNNFFDNLKFVAEILPSL